MSDFLRPLLALLPAIWKKRWQGLIVAWIVAALGAYGVLHYKERHLASATVYVDTQSALRPLMTGLTVNLDVSQQAAMLARNLLSPPNISEIIDQDHLLPPGSTPEEHSRRVQQLMKAIKIKINSRDNLYTISYIGTNPQQTLQLVKSLVNLFINQGVTGSREDASQAVQFINQQIAIYSKNLQAIENKLKDFKTEHPGYSGQNADYYTRVSQLQDQLRTYQAQLSSASSSRNTLRKQLSGINPDLPTTGNLALPGQPSSIDQRIAALRIKLSELLQTYTNEYPDVITTRQAIARLEQQKQRGGQDDTPHPTGVVPTAGVSNPVYQQLRVNLALADANIASLSSQINDTKTRLSHLQSQATQMPKLDEEYAKLNRSYTLQNDSYQKLVQRREAAVLSSNQNSSREQGYFRVVDPPRLNPTALFPRRTFLIAFVLIVAATLGIATAYLLVQMFPTFHTLRELRESTNRPVLGGIRLMRTSGQTFAFHFDRALFILGSSALVVIFVTWTVLNMLHLI